MQAKPDTEDGKARDARRQQSVEPVFGILKSAMGFTRLRLSGLQTLASEWLPTALAYTCRRLHPLKTA